MLEVSEDSVVAKRGRELDFTVHTASVKEDRRSA